MSPRTIVIKLGTSSIVHESTHQPLLSTLSAIVETVVHLRSDGHKVVLVSSGAIGVGLKRMNIESRPKGLSGKQALAAIGQGRLIALWDNLFGQLEQPIAQVLLTRGDISDRTRYLNAVNTFKELLSMGVVPIVNENDTVSVSEIRFGDNDTLSAITSSMIHADYLFLLTDVDGLYTSNPRKDPSAKHIQVVEDISLIRSQVSTSTLGSSLGTGGMETKLLAAEIATGAGTTTIICSSKDPSAIFPILQYHANSPSSPHHSANNYSSLTRHTTFLPLRVPLPDIKSWTTHTLHPSGSVIIDGGAHKVLAKRDSGGRLLAAGVLGVIGRFAGGVAVRICILSGEEGQQYEGGTGTVTPGRGPSRPSSRGRRGERKSSQFLDEADQLDGSGVLPPPVTTVFMEKDIVEVGRGLTNYNSIEIDKVKGMNSSQIPIVLGYADSEYVVENVTIRVMPQ